jgi:hypothetical protein
MYTPCKTNNYDVESLEVQKKEVENDLFSRLVPRKDKSGNRLITFWGYDYLNQPHVFDYLFTVFYGT